MAVYGYPAAGLTIFINVNYPLVVFINCLQASLFFIVRAKTPWSSPLHRPLVPHTYGDLLLCYRCLRAPPKKGLKAVV